MPAKDSRKLRDDAAAAAAAGKHKLALDLYLQIEQLEPRDAQWPKRAAEMYRRLGKKSDAIASYERAADRYVAGGFLAQAVAVCRIALQIEPQRPSALAKLAQITGQQDAEPSRLESMAESHPSLHGVAAVEAMRQRRASTAAPPAPVGAGTKTVGAGTKTVGVSAQGTFARGTGATPPATLSGAVTAIEEEESIPIIVGIASAHEEPPAEFIESADVALDDLDEVVTGVQELSETARATLRQSPLFAALPPTAIDVLAHSSTVVHVSAGEVLFREGDPSEVLYIICAGEVAVQCEGPPRVEMSRLTVGSFVGAVSLITEQTRTATATAVSPCQLLRIDRDAFARLLQTNPEALRLVLHFARDRLVERLVRTSPLFRPFAPAEAVALARRFRFLEIAPAGLILRAGARADGLYVLLAGHAQVQRDHQPVRDVGPGDLIGEDSLLAGTSVGQPVVAVSKCLALCLPAHEFHELIVTYPQVLEYVGGHATSPA